MMSLRRIKPGITAARNAGTGIFHTTLRHPHTGEPLEAVGVVGDEILWPVLGGAPEGGDDDEEGEEDSEGDDGAQEGEDDDSEGDEDDDGDGKRGKSGAKAKIAALTEEKDRHYRRRQKAEKERDEARAELEALKKAAKKTKPKAKAEDDADEEEPADDEEKAALRVENEKVKAENRKAKVENAFLRVNAVDWVNPGQVMTLLMSDDDYEVEFDDNGNVDRKSLAAELKRFAKANPHLVKPKPKQGETGDDDDQQGQRSGSSMNGQRKGKGKQEPTREALAKKYPALGTR